MQILFVLVAPGGIPLYGGPHSAFSDLLTFLTELFLACMADGICSKYLYYISPWRDLSFLRFQVTRCLS